MSGRNERRKKYYRRHLHTEFYKKLNALHLLPHLHCMQGRNKEEIQCICDRQGRAAGYDALIDRLLTRDEWFAELMDALIQAGHDDSADKLRKCDGDTSENKVNIGSPSVSGPGNLTSPPPSLEQEKTVSANGNSLNKHTGPKYAEIIPTSDVLYSRASRSSGHDHSSPNISAGASSATSAQTPRETSDVLYSRPSRAPANDHSSPNISGCASSAESIQTRRETPDVLYSLPSRSPAHDHSSPNISGRASSAVSTQTAREMFSGQSSQIMQETSPPSVTTSTEQPPDTVENNAFQEQEQPRESKPTIEPHTQDELQLDIPVPLDYEVDNGEPVIDLGGQQARIPSVDHSWGNNQTSAVDSSQTSDVIDPANFHRPIDQALFQSEGFSVVNISEEGHDSCSLTATSSELESGGGSGDSDGEMAHLRPRADVKE